jgi:putative protein-disulfide isomerase
MARILHYIHDPLCGWCYAAEKLTDAVAARAQGQFAIQLHAGGLFARTQLSDAKRSSIRFADARIGELTGQVFGEAYLNGLLGDPDVVYDSAAPIRGILAAQTIKPGSGVAMLKALQRAHYRRGLRIVESATIAGVAEGIGLDKDQFVSALANLGKAELQQHLDGTRRLMHDIGARGFPTFVAQIGGECQVLPHQRFYGDPDGFANLASNILGPQDLPDYRD